MVDRQFTGGSDWSISMSRSGNYCVSVVILGVAAPIAVTGFLGDRAPKVLDGWKSWLTQNNATVMSVLFLIFGVVLIAQGIEVA